MRKSHEINLKKNSSGQYHQETYTLYNKEAFHVHLLVGPNNLSESDCSFGNNAMLKLYCVGRFFFFLDSFLAQTSLNKNSICYRRQCLNAIIFLFSVLFSFACFYGFFFPQNQRGKFCQSIICLSFTRAN